MGEAKRRASAADITRHLHAAHAEGQGVWVLEVYTRDKIAGILYDAAHGDKKAHQLAQVIKSVVTGIATQPKDSPLLCLTCDYAFTLKSEPPAAFTVFRGYNDDAKHLTANLLCNTCAGLKDAKARIISTLKRLAIQDIREIKMAPGGHA